MKENQDTKKAIGEDKAQLSFHLESSFSTQ